MLKLSYDMLVGVGGGVLAGLLTLLIQWRWLYIQSLFDKEARRQAKQISGKWQATEVFLGPTKQNTYSMEINCLGGRVTGKHACLTGADPGEEFPIEGTFRDQILAFVWNKKGERALELGTVTVRLVRQGELEGHGLYVEPSDGKVYTSTFSAKIEK